MAETILVSLQLNYRTRAVLENYPYTIKTLLNGSEKIIARLTQAQELDPQSRLSSSDTVFLGTS